MNEQNQMNFNEPNPSAEFESAQAPQKRMSRMEYMLARGPQKTRILTYVAMGLAVISLVLLTMIGYNTVYGSLFDLPIVQMLVPAEDIADARDSLAYEFEEFVGMINEIDEEVASLTPTERRELEAEILEEEGMTLDEFVTQYKAELIAEFEKESGVPFAVAMDVVNNFSVHSLMTLLDYMPDMDGADEIFMIIKAVYKVLIGYFVVLGILIALSAIFLKKWTLILEFVLGFAAYIVFGGIVMTVALFALMLAYCIIISIENSDWKAYKHSF